MKPDAYYVQLALGTRLPPAVSADLVRWARETVLCIVGPDRGDTRYAHELMVIISSSMHGAVEKHALPARFMTLSTASTSAGGPMRG